MINHVRYFVKMIACQILLLIRRVTTKVKYKMVLSQEANPTHFLIEKYELTSKIFLLSMSNDTGFI